MSESTRYITENYTKGQDDPEIEFPDSIHIGGSFNPRLSAMDNLKKKLDINANATSLEGDVTTYNADVEGRISARRNVTLGYNSAVRNGVLAELGNVDISGRLHGAPDNKMQKILIPQRLGRYDEPLSENNVDVLGGGIDAPNGSVDVGEYACVYGGIRAVKKVTLGNFVQVRRDRANHGGITACEVEVGEECHIDGNISAEKTVRIGSGSIIEIDSDITADTVIIENAPKTETSHIYGNIIAQKRVEIGRGVVVEGDVKAGEMVYLGVGAEVKGDIIAPKRIREGTPGVATGTDLVLYGQEGLIRGHGPILADINTDGYCIGDVMKTSPVPDICEHLEQEYFSTVLKLDPYNQYPSNRERARDVIRYLWVDGELELSEDQPEDDMLTIGKRSYTDEVREYERVRLLDDSRVIEYIKSVLRLVPPKNRHVEGTIGVNFFRTFTDVVSGPHRDDEEFVFTHVINKDALGATSTLYQEGPDGKPSKKPYTSVTLNPGMFMFHNDVDLLHSVKSLKSAYGRKHVSSRPTFRDVVVCTIDKSPFPYINGAPSPYALDEIKSGLTSLIEESCKNDPAAPARHKIDVGKYITFSGFTAFADASLTIDPVSNAPKSRPAIADFYKRHAQAVLRAVKSEYAALHQDTLHVQPTDKNTFYIRINSPESVSATIDRMLQQRDFENVYYGNHSRTEGNDISCAFSFRAPDGYTINPRQGRGLKTILDDILARHNISPARVQIFDRMQEAFSRRLNERKQQATESLEILSPEQEKAIRQSVITSPHNRLDIEYVIDARQSEQLQEIEDELREMNRRQQRIASIGRG